jgi:hypothetical protein
MKKLIFSILLILCALPVMGKNLEGTFRTVDGQKFVGRTVKYTAEGVSFKLTEGPRAGAFSEKIAWMRFTPETLQYFATDLDARPYAQLLIVIADSEMDEEMASANERTEMASIEKPESMSHGREYQAASFIGSFFKGGGFLLLLLLYAANIYAGYELSFFRRYPIAVTCGAAAVAPFIGPIVFLCMPTKKKRRMVVEEPEEEEYEEEYAEGEYGEEVVAYDEYGNPLPAEPAYVEPEPEPEPEPVVLPETKLFKRGQFNLNRRFVESKFAGFFRAVPGENEKDMVLVVRAAQGEFISNRILKATNTEVTFAVSKGDAFMDKVIPLNDLLQIVLKHKDSPD